MNNVSFKSVYVLPQYRKQVSTGKNYINFMTETAPLKETYSNSRYDKPNDNYYIYIRDENDKKFENYALRYGINHRKANPAELDMLFLNKVIKMGAKYEVKSKNNSNIQNITIFDENGEKPFVRYTIDKTKGNNGILLAKEMFNDGEADMLISYNEDGTIKKTEIPCSGELIEANADDNGKLTFKY